MKLLKNLFIAGIVLLSMCLGVAVAGPVGGLVGGSLAYTGLQMAGLVQTPELSLFAVVAVGNIKRKDRQLDNLGGFTKMAIILPEAFSAHYPLKSQVTGMELTVAPTVTAGAKMGNLVIDLDSGNMKFSSKGEIENRNYSHDVSFRFSGVTPEQLVELDKTKGGCLIVGWDQDGVRWLAGSTKRPLKLEFDADLGSKPDDKKAITCKASRDGFAFPLLQFDDAVTLVLETLTELD